MPDNKREHQRKHCLVPVRFTYAGQGKTFYARMVNFGEGGVCLKTRTPIQEGAHLTLALEAYSPEGSSLGPFERQPVTVCWSKEVVDRGLPSYEAGLKYLAG